LQSDAGQGGTRERRSARFCIAEEKDFPPPRNAGRMYGWTREKSLVSAMRKKESSQATVVGGETNETCSKERKKLMRNIEEMRTCSGLIRKKCERKSFNYIRAEGTSSGFRRLE